MGFDLPHLNCRSDAIKAEEDMTIHGLDESSFQAAALLGNFDPDNWHVLSPGISPKTREYLAVSFNSICTDTWLIADGSYALSTNDGPATGEIISFDDNDYFDGASGQRRIYDAFKGLNLDKWLPASVYYLGAFGTILRFGKEAAYAPYFDKVMRSLASGKRPELGPFAGILILLRAFAVPQGEDPQKSWEALSKRLANGNPNEQAFHRLLLSAQYFAKAEGKIVSDHLSVSESTLKSALDELRVVRGRLSALDPRQQELFFFFNYALDNLEAEHRNRKICADAGNRWERGECTAVSPSPPEDKKPSPPPSGASRSPRPPRVVAPPPAAAEPKPAGGADDDWGVSNPYK